MIFKKRRNIIALTLIFALIISSAYAILSVVNNANVFIDTADVSAELWENFNGNTYNSSVINLSSGVIDATQEIEAEPWIKNTGTSNIITFMQVAIPKREVTYKESNGYFYTEKKEIVTTDISADWELQKKVSDEDNEYYLYCYKDVLLPEAETTPLFTTLKVIDIAKNSDENKEINIPIEVFAIQDYDYYIEKEFLDGSTSISSSSTMETGYITKNESFSVGNALTNEQLASLFSESYNKLTMLNITDKLTYVYDANNVIVAINSQEECEYDGYAFSDKFYYRNALFHYLETVYLEEGMPILADSAAISGVESTYYYDCEGKILFYQWNAIPLEAQHYYEQAGIEGINSTYINYSYVIGNYTGNLDNLVVKDLGNNKSQYTIDYFNNYTKNAVSTGQRNYFNTANVNKSVLTYSQALMLLEMWCKTKNIEYSAIPHPDDAGWMFILDDFWINLGDYGWEYSYNDILKVLSFLVNVKNAQKVVYDEQVYLLSAQFLSKFQDCLKNYNEQATLGDYVNNKDLYDDAEFYTLTSYFFEILNDYGQFFGKYYYFDFVGSLYERLSGFYSLYNSYKNCPVSKFSNANYPLVSTSGYSYDINTNSFNYYITSSNFKWCGLGNDFYIFNLLDMYEYAQTILSEVAVSIKNSFSDIMVSVYNGIDKSLSSYPDVPFTIDSQGNVTVDVYEETSSASNHYYIMYNRYTDEDGFKLSDINAPQTIMQYTIKDYYQCYNFTTGYNYSLYSNNKTYYFGVLSYKQVKDVDELFVKTFSKETEGYKKICDYSLDNNTFDTTCNNFWNDKKSLVYSNSSLVGTPQTIDANSYNSHINEYINKNFDSDFYVFFDNTLKKDYYVYIPEATSDNPVHYYSLSLESTIVFTSPGLYMISFDINNIELGEYKQPSVFKVFLKGKQNVNLSKLEIWNMFWDKERVGGWT